MLRLISIFVHFKNFKTSRDSILSNQSIIVFSMRLLEKLIISKITECTIKTVKKSDMLLENCYRKLPKI